jgi:hypothetical protein
MIITIVCAVVGGLLFIIICFGKKLCSMHIGLNQRVFPTASSR